MSPRYTAAPGWLDAECEREANERFPDEFEISRVRQRFAFRDGAHWQHEQDRTRIAATLEADIEVLERDADDVLAAGVMRALRLLKHVEEGGGETSSVDLQIDLCATALTTADRVLCRQLLDAATSDAARTVWADTWGRRLLTELDRLLLAAERAEQSATYWKQVAEETGEDNYRAAVERTAQLQRARARIRELEGR